MTHLTEVTGEYLPSEDRREPIVLTNCELNGVDPRNWDNGGFAGYNVEIGTGGALDLDPETSNSFSGGIVIEQPWTTAFDLTVSMNYYEIDVDNTIIEPSAFYIISDCYNSPTSTSPFCSRIQRVGDPEDPEIDFIDGGFINRDNDTVRGIDYNLVFEDTFTLFDRPFEVNLEWISHRLIQRDTLFINPLGTDDEQQDFSEWGYPQWRHTAILRLDVGDFRFTYRPRYIGQQNPRPRRRREQRVRRWFIRKFRHLQRTTRRCPLQRRRLGRILSEPHPRIELSEVQLGGCDRPTKLH